MPNPFPPSLQPRVIISLQSLLCNKQSFQSISVILLYPFHTLASLSITLTSNDSRHSLLLCVSHRLYFSSPLSLSWMGVHRQILFNPMPTPSTHAIHSISHFPSENQTPLSPSSSFSLNHLHNHSFPQFQLNASCFLPSLLHSPFSSFISLIHSPSLSLSIPILPFKFHPHRNASLSHASLIHSPSLSLSIPILPFKIHPHRYASLSHPLPISSPSFTHSFPHVFPSSSLNRHSLSPTHNLPQESATIRVRGLHTYIE